MNKQLDIIAAWWIPDDGNNFVMGRLTFSEAEGGRLELWGHFDKSEWFSRETNHEVLNGVSIDGQQITLEGCSWAGMEYRRPGVPKVKFHVEIVYVGRLFKSLHEIKFQDLYVCYSSMHAWIRESAFTVNPKFRGESFIGSDVKVRTPKEKMILKADTYTVRIVFGVGGLLLGVDATTSDMTIRQHNEFRISFKRAIRFDRNLDVLHYLHGFFSFCVGARVATISLRGQQRHGARQPSVEIYYRHGRRGDPSERVESENMLLTLPAAGALIGGMFERWITLGADIRPIYDMYLSAMYAQEMYIELRFLMMVQTCESLLRYLEGNTKKDWSIEKKLPDLITRHSYLSTKLVPDVELFSKEVAVSRHYYSHRNLSQQHRALRGADLINVTGVLKMLLEMDFLRLMGADQATIERAVRGKYKMTS